MGFPPRSFSASKDNPPPRKTELQLHRSAVSSLANNRAIFITSLASIIATKYSTGPTRRKDFRLRAHRTRSRSQQRRQFVYSKDGATAPSRHFRSDTQPHHCLRNPSLRLLGHQVLYRTDLVKRSSPPCTAVAIAKDFTLPPPPPEVSVTEPSQKFGEDTHPIPPRTTSRQDKYRQKCSTGPLASVLISFRHV